MVLLVHGEDDDMVPFDDARRLLAAGPMGRVQLLALPGRHDPTEALQTEQSRLVMFLISSLGYGPQSPEEAAGG